MNEWEGFKGVKWQKNIDVANFIEMNYDEYVGDWNFLTGVSKKTSKLLKKVDNLIKKEAISGVLDVETDIIAGIDNFEVGYIDRKNEVIVGLQTDEPLKRIINPYGGMNLVKKSLEVSGFRMDQEIKNNFQECRKTIDDGVFDVYTKDIKNAKKNYLISDLPDFYGRGEIIGDYRRLALYGTDLIIKRKLFDLEKLSDPINNTTIRLREETSEQIKAIEKMVKMAKRYGFDITKPASNAKEAIQWIYFAYLASIKKNNGLSMSIGRNATFIDIYIERDIKKGILTEQEAQELLDQFVIKLSLSRHLRTPLYNEFFPQDTNLIAETIGGMLNETKSLITKTSYRLINTLNNVSRCRQPNIDVLWSYNLPDNFKKYLAEISIKTHSICFYNDDLINNIYGRDYAISNSTSASSIGRQIQLNGAHCNLAKALLYALNGGRDEITGQVVIEDIEQITGEYLDYDEVLKLYSKVLRKLAKTYVDSLNIVHYMHDKYAYESIQMAFNDTIVNRLMTFSIVGLSNVVDSLSAIKYGNVRVKRDERGITTSFDNETDYPHYGNNDDRADDIAIKIITKFCHELKKYPLYRNAEHSLSISSLTTNILYGKNTGSTPDGRVAYTALSKDANANFGCDKTGALASLSSTAKIPYNICTSGIANTFFINKETLGPRESRINNLVQVIDGYFKQGGQNLNLNVIDRQTLIDAMSSANKNSNLYISLSGTVINFSKLLKTYQEEILASTFHDTL